MKTTGGTEYEIRPATVTDISELIRMQTALQESTEAQHHRLLGFNAANRAKLHEYYLARLKDELTQLLLAQTVAPLRVVGMGTGKIWLHADYLPSRSGEMIDLWIDPEHRRRNLATWILTGLVRFFQVHGVELFTVNYVQGNRPGEEFWRRLGFEPALVTATADRLRVETALGLPRKHKPPLAYRSVLSAAKQIHTYSALSG